VASARLFAVVVDRRQRLVALRFLAMLMEQADHAGRVHVDPDDLVGLGLLNGLQADEVDRSRRLLELVGVLDREGEAWRIAGFGPDEAGLPHAHAMAAIAQVLEPPAPAPDWSDVEPEPAAVRTGRRSAWRFGVAAGAAAVAAGVALLVVAPQELRLPTRSASNAGAQRTHTVAGAPSASGGSTATTALLSRIPSTTGSPSPSSGSSAAGSTACPGGRVVAAVDRVVQEPSPPPSPSTSTPPTSVPTGVTADVPGVVRTTVYGTLENPSSAAVVVDPFPVDVVVTGPSGVNSSTTTATVLSAPVTVPPGVKVPWQVSVDAPPQGAGSMTAKARLGTWRWADPVLATACKR